MKIKSENKIDDSVMKHITGGALGVSHETSADEMEHFTAPLVQCPMCAGTSFEYKFFVLGSNSECRMGQKCLKCGYSWTFGVNLEYKA